ncbi:MAG: DUF3467 domain-containing protein [Oceanicaulis sp.]|jgi:hypothetical protein|nr:DUF3467 domain-containing protein [Oceanicaulis sp.]
MSDTPSPKPPAGPRLTIDPEIGLGQYANFVSIAHNFTEVLFDFGRTLPGRSDIPVVSRLIMSPFQAKQLLRALNHNLELYERSFGPIADPPTAGGAPAPPNTSHDAN